MDAYQQRVIAYADVLGWTNACNNPRRYQDVRAAATGIRDYALNFSKPIKDALKNTKGVTSFDIEQQNQIEFCFFSDNFAVSAPADHAQTLLKILSFASDALLQRKFLLRGAVTLGLLYHDHHGVIFGPALIDAVEIEKTAYHPRLLCSESVVELLDKAGLKENLLLQDSDQRWVVNIAIGSSHALSNLNKIIDDEIATSRKFSDKWIYLRKLLQSMHSKRRAQ